MGIVNALMRMGAHIKIIKANKNIPRGQEPSGDILVRGSSLKGVRIGKSDIPSLIDELPVLMVAASLAKGKTVLSGVGELRVKETDRIFSMTENLRKMGVSIKVLKLRGNCEEIIIDGRGELNGASLKSFGDHRSAMSMVVAAFAAKGKSRIDDISCINKSFPGFINTLNSLRK